MDISIPPTAPQGQWRANETLESEPPFLVASIQADPSSRQLCGSPPTRMQEFQNKLASSVEHSPVSRQAQCTVESCTVCGHKCRDVYSLQEHLLFKHCGQAPDLARTLQALEQKLSSILANQAAQSLQMNRLELTQISTKTKFKN